MKTLKIMTVIAFIVFALSQCKKCEYNLCEDVCDPIETFEDTSHLWQGINVTPQVDIITQTLTASSLDRSYIYNIDDYPTSLADAGCELRYEVKVNSPDFFTIDTTLIIFNGTSPTVNTQSAIFVLNPASVIYTNHSALTTIAVPIETTTGTTLPMNGFGSWVINGGPPYSSSDITDFNNLIQNISGIGFKTNGTSGLSQSWSFDNFCITDCCTNEVIQID